jgi:hypothetical protein
MPKSYIISTDAGLFNESHSDMFQQSDHVNISCNSYTNNTHVGLEDETIDDNGFIRHTLRKYSNCDIDTITNIEKFLENFALLIAMIVMCGLKSVRYYCIYIAVHVLREDGNHLIIFLFMIDMLIDIFFQITSSKCYNNRYGKRAKKKYV